MVNYTKQELIENTDSGYRYTYHVMHLNPNNQLDFNKKCEFTANSGKYYSIAHFLAVEKARLTGSYSIMNELLRATYDGNLSELIKKIEGLGSSIWNEVRDSQVAVAYSYMLESNPKLKEKLMEIEEDVFVAANPKDSYWCTGLKVEDGNNLRPDMWEGENRLGMLITLVRDSFKREMNETETEISI